MKNLLVAFVFFITWFSNVRAQSGYLLINENFTGLTTGDLTPANGNWINNQNNGRVQVVNNAALFHPLIISGTEYVTIQKSANGDDPYKKYAGNHLIPFAANTVVYMSFLVKVDNANQTTSTGNNNRSVLALGYNGSNDEMCFHIGNNGNGSNNLKFGISKSGGTGAAFASGNFAFGQVHLVIIKYVYVAGNSNDLMYMWVNPATSIFGGELPVSSAAVSITNGNDIQSVLNSTGFEQNNNGATASFDCLRVAYAFSVNGSSASATGSAAWTSLSPGTTLLPMKFGSLHAKQIGDAIKLNWDTFSDDNINYFDVERSASASDFISIGQVKSLNSPEQAFYDITDTKPFRGINYYRIRSVALDGSSTYSMVLKVNTGGNEEKTMNVFPNPVNDGRLSIQLSNFDEGVYTAGVYNISGVLVYKQSFNHKGFASNQVISLPSALSDGIYTLILSNGSNRISKSIKLGK